MMEFLHQSNFLFQTKFTDSCLYLSFVESWIILINTEGHKMTLKDDIIFIIIHSMFIKYKTVLSLVLTGRGFPIYVFFILHVYSIKSDEQADIGRFQDISLVTLQFITLNIKCSLCNVFFIKMIYWSNQVVKINYQNVTSKFLTPKLFCI